MYQVLFLVAGLVLASAAILYMMRHFMIVSHRLDCSFEAASDSLEAAVTSVDGWGMPMPSFDFLGAIQKRVALRNVRKQRLFFVCKGEYAGRIVDAHPWVGAMMPCTWALYEMRDGTVRLAKFNIALMSKVFFGSVIGRTMALVAREEHEMLERLKALGAAWEENRQERAA